MTTKNDLTLIGFFIGLVIIIGIIIVLKAKKTDNVENALSVANPVSNYDFFSSDAKDAAQHIYITSFDDEGNIYPLNLDTFIYGNIRTTQNALMDQVKELLDGYVKKNESYHMQVDGVGRLQTDGNKYMKAAAGGDGQSITLF
jgi:hypothetical protein